MKSKWLFLVMCAVVAILPSVGNAAATQYSWYGGPGNWEDPNNWTPNHEPNNITNDNALVISSGGLGVACHINSHISVFTPIFGLGYGFDIDTPCIVNIEKGASLSSGTELQLSAGANSYAVLNVYGTANLASLRVAMAPNSKGVMNVDGGTCTVTAFGTYIGCDFFGDSTDGVAQVNLTHGGVFIIDGMCYLETDKPFKFGLNGSIHLGDGGGILKVKGDVQTLVQGYITAGKITAGADAVLRYDVASDHTIYASGSVCTRFLEGDINHDCFVNFKDFAAMANEWLQCTSITQPGCTP